MRAVELYEQIRESVGAIHLRAGASAPAIGVILGSGLGSFVDSFEGAISIPYEDIPHFPRSSVPGHPGRLVIGKVGGVPSVAMQGRIHYYEGYSPSQVAYPTRVLCALGVRTVIVTNAAGGINASFAAGDLMAIVDHINLAGWNPLVGPNDDRLGPRFPDMTAAYDSALTALLVGAGASCNAVLKRGVYAMLTGPSYETPAEIHALRVLGADAVGMSTVPEVIAARHMNAKVVGISCITNLAAGVGRKPLTHEEVEATANRVRGVFSAILTRFIPAAAKV